MPEVRRGSRSFSLPTRPTVNLRSTSDPNPNHSTTSPTPPSSDPEPVLVSPDNRDEDEDAGCMLFRSGAQATQRRQSLAYAERPEAAAYYDSRAATRREYRRRGTTLQDYYDQNPDLLPQLPFTWHHGWKRWRLGILIFLMFVDACVLPIVLYYAMYYVGHVQGFIIFIIVTTIWGGPTYVEFGIRTIRLIKKEQFYRPLGTTSRWSFDLVTYASVICITAVTALFIVGSAPHIVWLRVLCMPGPAILYSLGGVLALLSLYNVMGWKAPFRISSTAKGEEVLPGAYYFMEDVVAVNAGGGRPYREALAARYQASHRFRRMLVNQSLFWSIPSLILAIPLTVIAVIHAVPAKVAYGICESSTTTTSCSYSASS